MGWIGLEVDVDEWREIVRKSLIHLAQSSDTAFAV